MVVVAMTQGAKKSSTTQQVDDLTLALQSDIDTVQNAVGECVLTHKDPVDIDNNGTIDATDNPNAPFPLYGDLSSGGAGTALANIKCPGAPSGSNTIFNNDAGRMLKILSDTATYTSTYLSDSTEGILIAVRRTSSNPAWTEAISRVNDHYSTCEAAYDTAGGCANGCFYFWIKRLSTSVTAVEATCP